ncbi:MAG: sodium-dependent bicarbonate transport family permease [Burkholderiaceae bacterium]|nr:sodium-dependent bicarbonate transport family permease [Burkholderiaceae bacterium]
MIIDPVVGFFVLGAVAAVLRSDLKLPAGLIDVLSIYLLIAIGLKGGVELAQAAAAPLAGSIAVAVLMSAGTPLLAYPVLRGFGGLPRPDAASIAAHYGSVSVVTFAVGASFLTRQNVPFEGYLSVLLVFLEFPALIIGVLLARGISRETPWRTLAHEVLAGKAIVLLIGALAIGWVAGADGAGALIDFYGGMFKGVLSLFLLAMGMITASRLADLRQTGAFLIGFGIVVPIVSGFGGALVGYWLGLSVGGTTLLATLYASASYIAAPAAMRIAVPEANPALSMGASLGVTFPFNVLVGIPLYHALARFMHTPSIPLLEVLPAG